MQNTRSSIISLSVDMTAHNRGAAWKPGQIEGRVKVSASILHNNFALRNPQASLYATNWITLQSRLTPSISTRPVVCKLSTFFPPTEFSATRQERQKLRHSSVSPACLCDHEVYTYIYVSRLVSVRASMALWMEQHACATIGTVRAGSESDLF